MAPIYEPSASIEEKNDKEGKREKKTEKDKEKKSKKDGDGDKKKEKDDKGGGEEKEKERKFGTLRGRSKDGNYLTSISSVETNPKKKEHDASIGRIRSPTNDSVRIHKHFNPPTHFLSIFMHFLLTFIPSVGESFVTVVAFDSRDPLSPLPTIFLLSSRPTDKFVENDLSKVGGKGLRR